MAVRQSNHDTWCLPECLSALNECRPLMLWEAVAHWTLRQGRFVNRDELAQVFRIAPRRAADIVRYILRSQPDVVTGSSLVVRREDGARQMLFQVTQVVDRPPPAPPAPRPRRDNAAAARRHAVAALRRTFLRNRVG
ncbi:CaiF/GrlA family transcriptional regulator [Serratia ureilytica]|uniref:CaiF/GrlA family transcriptional regulator n=1 Tax=Serratia ureilytica TaxID=300181 RepID=UPI00313DE74B